MPGMRQELSGQDYRLRQESEKSEDQFKELHQLLLLPRAVRIPGDNTQALLADKTTGNSGLIRRVSHELRQQRQADDYEKDRHHIIFPEHPAV